jgi:N6-adenosine-specific RNA methylase IME4
VFSGRSFEAHVEAWQKTVKDIEQRQWYLGSIAESVARNYEEQGIERFARAVGCKASTVWQYAQVYQRFKNSERSELSWSHHLVASYSDDPERALEQAAKGNLSVQGLRLVVRTEQQRKFLLDQNQIAQFESLGKFRSILFRAIVVDPPWEYDDQGSRVSAGWHYDTLSINELASMPIGEIAASEGCHLYLWVTNSFMRQAYRLLDAWGFEEKTIITWVKETKDGRVTVGFGHYFRNATEHMIFASKGNLPTLCSNQPNVLFAGRQRHSQKPESAYRVVERMSPPPYLEVIGRRKRKGWTVWGNEVMEPTEVVTEG